MTNVITGEVEFFKYKADDYEIQVKYCDFIITVHTYEKVTIGEIVHLHIAPEKIKIKKREEITEENEQ